MAIFVNYYIIGVPLDVPIENDHKTIARDSRAMKGIKRFEPSLAVKYEYTHDQLLENDFAYFRLYNRIPNRNKTYIVIEQAHDETSDSETMTLVNPSEECMRSVYKQFNTSKEQLKEDVQLIKDWLRDQPHLPHIQDDVCLEGMLLRCKFSVERAKQAWDMIFTLKTALPEIFSNRDPMGADIQAVLNGLNVAPMPDVTSDGYRVIILKCLSKDATLFNPEAFAKCAFMVTDIRIGEDKSVGDIYIYDMENVTIGHISRMTLPMFKKLEMISSEGYKSRIKGVHFINAPPVMDVLMTMIKKFIKSKLAARHHVHTTLTSLYEHVDREVLPVEYGGQASSCFEIGANWKKKLESNRDWFQQQDLVGKADESKRPGKSFNSSEFFGFEGTFKKLCVD